MEAAKEQAHMAMERKNLAKAELDIAEGERRITSLLVQIERMREQGQNVGEAEELLSTLRQTLDTWVMHRDTILHELEQHHAFPARHETMEKDSGKAPRQRPRDGA